MQDIDVIQRKNGEAVRAAADAAHAEGKLVLFKFSGLNFIDYSLHADEAGRNAAAIAWSNESPGNRAEFRPGDASVKDARPSSSEA